MKCSMISKEFAVALIATLLVASAVGATPIVRGTPVTVMNTAADGAVPVTGTVGIAGPINVNIGNTPTVIVDVTNPLLVKTQDAPQFIVPVKISGDNLAAEITLPAPAILEKFAMHCAAGVTRIGINTDPDSFGFPSNGATITNLNTSGVWVPPAGNQGYFRDIWWNVTGTLPLTPVDLTIQSKVAVSIISDSVTPIVSNCAGIMVFHNVR